MVARAVIARRRAAGPSGLHAMATEAKACRRCDLYKVATQTVFGEGNPQARIVLVGEQPGDNEDLLGRPFVGPAGRLLRKAMDEAGLAAGDCYITNAVKHFKYEWRGKRRLHTRPNSQEIVACRWWLARELRAIRPALVIALGVTAATALAGKPVTITALRGQRTTTIEGVAMTATVHPSSLLRMPEEADREDAYRQFVEDLRRAATELARPGPNG